MFQAVGGGGSTGSTDVGTRQSNISLTAAQCGTNYVVLTPPLVRSYHSERTETNKTYKAAIRDQTHKRNARRDVLRPRASTPHTCPHSRGSVATEKTNAPCRGARPGLRRMIPAVGPETFPICCPDYGRRYRWTPPRRRLRRRWTPLQRLPSPASVSEKHQERVKNCGRPWRAQFPSTRKTSATTRLSLQKEPVPRQARTIDYSGRERKRPAPLTSATTNTVGAKVGSSLLWIGAALAPGVREDPGGTIAWRTWV